MRTYELGGVRFLVFEDEIYCRYADVYDEGDAEEEEPQKVPAKKRTTRKCGKCGRAGHTARTCPRAETCAKCGEVGHFADSCKFESENPNETPPQLDIYKKVREMREAGCSLDEIVLAFPSSNTQDIREIFEELVQSDE